MGNGEQKDNWEYKAYLTWDILADCAAREEPTIYYSELGQKIDVTPLNVRLALSKIQDYCLEEKLPPLTVLAISKASQKPSSGYKGDNSEVNEVQKYEWEKLDNPFSYASDGETTIESLSKFLLANPEKSKEVYYTVKSRGVGQSIFRAGLLEAYQNRCAFCGFSFEEALEAAHIISWNEAEYTHKTSINNGLLLCAIHHRLYDTKIISINEEYKIIKTGDKMDKKKSMSQIDNSLTQNLVGKRMNLPKNEKYYPDKELIKKRNG